MERGPSPAGYAWTDSHTLQLQFSNLPDDNFTLTLFSRAGAFQDVAGNIMDGEPHAPFALPSGDGQLGGDFVVHFSVDAASAAFPTPLKAENPLGSLIYDGSTSAAIGTGSDTDSFTITLDAGQTLTAVVVPASALQPTLCVTGPGGFSAGPVTATAAGKQVFLQTLHVAAAGTYTITVGSASGTTGHYSLQLTLNAAVELEEHDGASNNTFATAQALDGAFLALDDSAQRAAVVGATCYPQTIVAWNMDTNPGWTYQGQWAWGTPTGGGSYYGDPTSGHTGTNVVGYNLNGDYPDNMSVYYATTPAISTLGYSDVKLSFWRWLGVEQSSYDHATIQISTNGSAWTTVWQNPDNTIADSAWTLVTYDISAVADNQPVVYIRWSMGPSDSSVTLPGWNIDDVSVMGVPAGKGDYYRFDLAAGQSASVALKSLAADKTTLSLYDANQQPLVLAVPAANADWQIDPFVSAAGGTYYVYVTGCGAPIAWLLPRMQPSTLSRMIAWQLHRTLPG